MVVHYLMKPVDKRLHYVQNYCHITHKLELTIKGAQSYESHRQVFTLCTKVMVGVVSLSVFGGNFVLAKVHLGLISVCSSELRGVCFSEVQNVFLEGSLLKFLLYTEHKPKKNVKE